MILTPIVPVLVPRMSEYNSRRGIELPDVQYHFNEAGDVEAHFVRRADSNGQHQEY